MATKEVELRVYLTVDTDTDVSVLVDALQNTLDSHMLGEYSTSSIEVCPTKSRAASPESSNDKKEVCT
jgi:hypothetical protein